MNAKNVKHLNNIFKNLINRYLKVYFKHQKNNLDNLCIGNVVVKNKNVAILYL